MELDLKKFGQYLHASFIELSPALFLFILTEVTKGLHFLHLLNYAHRDIHAGLALNPGQARTYPGFQQIFS
jgi:serine/threonine protein kinase